MKFKDGFPSLKGLGRYTRVMAGQNDYEWKYLYHPEHLKKYCLDKQKVKENMNAFLDTVKLENNSYSEIIDNITKIFGRKLTNKSVSLED